jgi:hypothetical protein
LSLHIEVHPLFENAALLREILTWEEKVLNNISKTAFLEGMKKLKEHANKCIDRRGMYFEE